RLSVIKDKIGLPVSLSTIFSYYKKTNHEFDESYELFKIISSSKRYSHIQVIDFLDEKDEKDYKQFFALTYLLENNTLFIAFRGTDDSWVGWKENMSLLYESHIPSHSSSLNYIKYIIKV
ncbi:MAG: Mbeg1-like protein, partial [Acutalibacteraceae bacterium]|nr:Mbeg1-like protein [Acutalibacteraceae bacterium]